MKKIISLLSISGLVILTGCDKNLELKDAVNKSVTFELGDKIEINEKKLMNKDIDFDYDIKDVKLDFNKDELTKVGSYKATVYYADEKANFTIKIKDTKSPVFSDDEVVITLTENQIKDKKDFDINQYVKATDLSACTLSVDLDKVDFVKEGSYEVTVKAVDTSKNEATKKVTIKINKVEEVKPITPAAKPSIPSTQTPNNPKPSNPSTQTPNKPAATPTRHSSAKYINGAWYTNIGNSGMVFNSIAEAHAWAETQTRIDRDLCYAGKLDKSKIRNGYLVMSVWDEYGRDAVENKFSLEWYW